MTDASRRQTQSLSDCELPDERFIFTDTEGLRSEHAELRVCEAVKKAFSGREWWGYWRFPVFPKLGNYREPDVLLLDKEIGIAIIEVKSYTIDCILGIEGQNWHIRGLKQSTHPYQQALSQLSAVEEKWLKNDPQLKRVGQRALIALPEITRAEWMASRFAVHTENWPFLFKDDLGPQTLLKCVMRTAPRVYGQPLGDAAWRRLAMEKARVPKMEIDNGQLPPLRGESKRDLIQIIRESTVSMDSVQLRIGLQIPPGPQRIRGVAGSGKTFALCRKAANMHIKHPDWNIALVFFSKSMYSQIQEQVARWLNYDGEGHVDMALAMSKLKVMHAWGSRDCPGFYQTVRRQFGIDDRDWQVSAQLPPQVKLAVRCRMLLEHLPAGPASEMFDAVLIDEAQDLVIDADAFPEAQYENKQSFFWLAHRVLCPVDPAQPDQRRLIWAYDEGQSLNAMSVPDTTTIFGEELKHVFQSAYPGNIRKSEIMTRCYRTPGRVLTAAHAIGMGLLRPNGLCQNLGKSDWKALGYEVYGDFLSGRSVTILRPKGNSLHPLVDSTIEFQSYPTREAELKALALAIKNDIAVEGLSPSRQILVIDLTDRLAADIGRALGTEGITYFRAGAKVNNVSHFAAGYDGSRFWCRDAVTISGIHQAKGNEADMVYILGCDYVAEHEADPRSRNALFTALTRTRGWVRLSGTGDHLFYSEELQKVFAAGDRFEFVYRKPQRNLSPEGSIPLPLTRNLSI